MAQVFDPNLADYIKPLAINGLRGRVLRLPAPKGHKRDILFIYGQHSTIERWRGLTLVLNRYGALTMPDLPGFGGMDSFYSVGKEPTMDTLADYLADFINQEYGKTRHVNIAAMSIGFPIVTRMLQRHPDLTKRVDMLVSIVGFSHHDDFSFTAGRMGFYKIGSTLFSRRWPAWFFRHVFLQPAYLRRVYRFSRNARSKFDDKHQDDFNETMDIEIKLWHQNDVRTQFRCNLEMFHLDNTGVPLPLPVWHVDVAADQYFKPAEVEKHLRMIFSEYHLARSKVDNHAPSVIADAATAAPYVPLEIRRALSKL